MLQLILKSFISSKDGHVSFLLEKNFHMYMDSNAHIEFANNKKWFCNQRLSRNFYILINFGAIKFEFYFVECKVTTMGGTLDKLETESYCVSKIIEFLKHTIHTTRLSKGYIGLSLNYP